jgi:hypothetical protein
MEDRWEDHLAHQAEVPQVEVPQAEVPQAEVHQAEVHQAEVHREEARQCPFPPLQLSQEEETTN